MRRVHFVLLWLLLPIAAGAYHFGPGQDQLRADRAASAAQRAAEAAREARRVAAESGDAAARSHWAEAAAACTEALAHLPAGEEGAAFALRIERAKAQMFISELPEAREDLESVVEELANSPAATPQLLADARTALASAQYYTTWLMRLEGVPREEWEREIQSARQNYRWLAERAEAEGDAERAARAKEDLEAAVRLARMELDELQGLPLPSQ